MASEVRTEALILLHLSTGLDEWSNLDGKSADHPRSRAIRDVKLSCRVGSFFRFEALLTSLAMVRPIPLVK